MKAAKGDIKARLDALRDEAREQRARDARRAEALIATIERKRPRIERTFYDVARCLDELRRDDLHLALGFASFDAMLRGRALFSPTQARKLVAVARALPREAALRLGSERASAVVVYAAALGSDPSKLLAGGHRVGDVTLDRATPRALREAARAARPPRPRDLEARRAMEARVRRVKRWLRAQGVRGATVSHARDRVTITLALDAADAL